MKISILQPFKKLTASSWLLVFIVNLLVTMVILCLVNFVCFLVEPVELRNFFTNVPVKIPIELDNENPLVGMRLIPGGIGTTLGKSVVINQQGFRDKEYGPKGEAFRILAVGDSFTFGWGVDQDKSYPKILEAKLKDEKIPIDVEVLNLGVPGTSTIHQYHALKEKYMKLRPDIVVIGYLVNDIDHPFSMGLHPSEIVLNSDIWSKFALGRRLGRILFYIQLDSKLTKVHMQLYKDSPQRKELIATIKKLKKLSELANFKLIFAMLPVPTDYQKDIYMTYCYKIITNILKKNNIEYINVISHIKNKDLRDMAISSFDYHPNKVLHAKIADVIKNNLMTKFEHLKRLMTYYLTTDDGTLYYLIFGVKYVVGKIKSFIAFHQIDASKKMLSTNRTYDKTFTKVNDNYFLDNNELTEKMVNNEVVRNVKFDINNKMHVKMDVEIRHRPFSFAASAYNKKDIFSAYMIKCLKSNFSGNVEIDGKKYQISGDAFIDSWVVNKNVNKGHWDWGISRGDEYSIMHYKKYFNSQIGNSSKLFVWKKNKLLRVVSDPVITLDKMETKLKMSYKSKDLSVEQVIDYASPPKWHSPTWYAPFKAKVKYQGIEKVYTGKAIVEKKQMHL